MNNLKDILKSGRILMYGYSDKNLPVDLNIQDESFCIYNKLQKNWSADPTKNLLENIVIFKNNTLS